jgi:mannose-6-phosphate isomerase-like protein (cupin superfamily)
MALMATARGDGTPIFGRPQWAVRPITGFKLRNAAIVLPMGNYTKKNLRNEVEDQAPKFDMPSEMEARFARTPLGGETLGLSLMTLAPNFRVPFGHKHEGQEEVYVVVRGSGRIKVEDEVVEVGEWDAIRFDKNTMRNVEAGPDGIEFVAFGAGEDPRDAEMAPNWWSD